MKEMLLRQAGYNAWANKRLTDVMMPLPVQAIIKESESSFPTLKDTALHMWATEFTWLRRLHGDNDPMDLQQVFIGLFHELCNAWHRTSLEIVHFVENCTEEQLVADFTFQSRKGDTYTISLADLLHHIFNHSTVHRGQLVTQLRIAGVTDIPWTDYLGYAFQVKG